MGRIKNWGIGSLLKQIYEREKIYENITNPTTPSEDERYYNDLRLHVELGICIECNRKTSEVGWRTNEERSEFDISALCSECQIKYFGK
jgi:hypothetical protein